MENRKLIKGIYRHFKAKDMIYKVEGVATNSETMEEMVIYRALYGKNNQKLYVRPMDMFLEKVPEGRENPNNQTYRFEYIGEDKNA
ncbi:MAG: DUF1653 domain-containing protein [Clostridia bacterium]